MNVIFLGSVLPIKLFTEIASVTPSANNLQNAIVANLKERYGDKLCVFTANGKLHKSMNRRLVKPNELTLECGQKTITAGYLSIRALNTVSMICSLTRLLFKHFRNISRSDKQERTVILVYNPYYQWTLPAYLATVIFKADLFTFIADVADYRKVKVGRITLYDHIANALNCKILSLNKGLVSWCKWSPIDYAPKVPYIELLHPFYEETYSDIIYEKPNDGLVRILYTGLLHSCYGIELLLESLDYLPNNYRLIICGQGDESIERAILNKAKCDKRIDFKGLIPRDEAIRMQGVCDLLALIRISENPIDEYLNQYCSPSKLIEYLVSGTPIIATQIRAFPCVLSGYLNFVESTTRGVAQRILYLTQNSYGIKEAKDKAISGKIYAIENCISVKQFEKVNDFIKDGGEQL